jgi:signal transduction histidine kinase
LALKGEARSVTISIHNDGIPIPPYAIGRIFESLVRGDDEWDEECDAPIGSINLGLGLYITKEIIVAHGGTIDVTSSEKDGTVFTVRLPRLSNTAAPQPLALAD